MDNILGTSPEKAKESSKKYYVRKELKDSIKKSFELDDRKIAQLKEFIKNNPSEVTKYKKIMSSDPSKIEELKDKYADYIEANPEKVRKTMKKYK